MKRELTTRVWVSMILGTPLVCPCARGLTAADFQQAITTYQQAPSDATAQDVIKMAAVMEQLPSIAENAREHFVMGQTIFKAARNAADFSLASHEFDQAVHIAPWWPEARYNRALALEAAGDYAGSIAELRLYLLCRIPEAEARAAQDKIYALKAKGLLAAKAAQDAQVAAAEEARAKAEQQRRDYEASPEGKLQALLRKIDGRRYTVPGDGSVGAPLLQTLDVRGTVLVMGSIGVAGTSGYLEGSRTEIRGRETVIGPFSFIISDDCESITLRLRRSNGTVLDRIFLWQR